MSSANTHTAKSSFRARMDSVAEPSPNSSIRRQPGRQLLDSVADFSLRIDDYGSTPVRNHSGSEAACEKPALRGKMFNSEAAAGLSTGTVRQANWPVYR